jgi:large subunit ribosomal protein L25
MKIEFKAQKRQEQGSSASRRLRRAGSVPGIIYGGEATPLSITLNHNDLYHLLKKEAFHASVLHIDVEGKDEMVILRDTQWHAYKPLVLHVDFQRVDATHKLHIKVPLHFINADIAPAVKLGGGIISHVMNEIDIECLADQLPEFIEVDLKDVEADQSIHVSQLVLPQGVSVVSHGEGDPVVATVLKTRGDAAAADETTD